MNNFNLHMKLGNELGRLAEKYFGDDIKLTLIARKPGNNDADLAISDDTPSEVSKAVDRWQDRAGMSY